jgi:hypothetical protein
VKRRPAAVTSQFGISAGSAARFSQGPRSAATGAAHLGWMRAAIVLDGRAEDGKQAFTVSLPAAWAGSDPPASRSAALDGYRCRGT